MYAFIAAGNMGGALARALCKTLPAQQVILYDILPEKARALAEELGCIAASDAADVNGVSVVVKALKDVDMNGLRDLGDSLKEKLPTSVIVLASENDGKVSLMVTATDAAIKMGAHAGNIVKEAAKLVGGGGGGRPNMAQAGGKNPAGIKDALDKAVEVLKNQIK